MSNSHPSSIRVDSPAADGLSGSELLRLGLRVLLEVSIVLSLGYWGFRAGSGTVVKIVLALAAPLLGFGFWGAVDFHQAGRWAETLRLSQELLISGLAAVALFVAGQPAFGVVLILLSIVYHALVYLLGGRLLERRLAATTK